MAEKKFHSIEIPIYDIEYSDLISSKFETFIETAESSLDAERFFKSISNLELELFLLRYFGYSSKEIVKIMNLKNIAMYYRIHNKLKESFTVFYKNDENVV